MRGEPEPGTVVVDSAALPSAFLPNGNDSAPDMASPVSLVDRLIAAKMDRPGALRLSKKDPAECERQLRYLPFRQVDRNQGGLLNKLISERAGAPQAYLDANPPPGAPQAKKPTEPAPKRQFPMDWFPGLEEEVSRVFLNKAVKALALRGHIPVADVPICDALRDTARQFWRDENPDKAVPWDEQSTENITVPKPPVPKTSEFATTVKVPFVDPVTVGPTQSEAERREMLQRQLQQLRLQESQALEAA